MGYRADYYPHQQPHYNAQPHYRQSGGGYRGGGNQSWHGNSTGYRQLLGNVYPKGPAQRPQYGQGAAAPVCRPAGRGQALQPQANSQRLVMTPAQARRPVLPTELPPAPDKDPTRPAREIVPDEPFDNMRFWEKGVPAPRGLRNLSNTCFMNSCLQCLGHTCMLVKTLQRDCRSATPAAAPNWLGVLQDYVGAVYSLNRAALEPWALAKGMSVLNKTLVYGRQEDAQEYLNHLLEACHDQLLTRYGLGQKEDPMVAATSHIRRIFGGFLRSRVEWDAGEERAAYNRPDCKPPKGHEKSDVNAPNTSDTFDCATALSLEITDLHSLEGALASFTAAEKLDDKYRTPQGALVSASKRLTIMRPPRVLVCHLKRFESNPFTGATRKLHHRVSFPTELDLAPYCSYRGEHRYRLYAVLVHEGSSPTFGHCYAYARHLHEDGTASQWRCLNDSTVTTVTEDRVKNAEAYLLFYSRISPSVPAPPPPRPQQQAQACGNDSDSESESEAEEERPAAAPPQPPQETGKRDRDDAGLKLPPAKRPGTADLGPDATAAAVAAVAPARMIGPVKPPATAARGKGERRRRAAGGYIAKNGHEQPRPVLPPPKQNKRRRVPPAVCGRMLRRGSMLW